VSYPVGRAAELAGVSVRTLHHYDEIGLLRPLERSPAGYRLYRDGDLERLRQIVLYRELGFSLEEIAAILDPESDPLVHLRRQHRMLTERMERLRRMAAAVEYEMEARQVGISLTPEERFELFGDFRPEDYEAEAEERWGGSDAYRESQRRVSSYTKRDWRKIKSEAEAIDERLARLLSSGAAADSEAAMDAAEQHRLHITRWFYDCTSEIHVGLAEMYVADPRFKSRYEAIAPGLAEFVRAAVNANAAR
jgi:MerR family transcriptional regulator, thiopeptide resistance regulator